MLDSVLRPVRQTFRAIATTVVPEAASLDAAGWEDVECIIEDALASRPAPLRRRLRLFIRAIQVMPIARYGRPFTSLDAARRTRVLRALENSPVLLLRRGFWGVRTLVFMGYYARPAAAAEIGYRAHVRGWSAREAGSGRVPACGRVDSPLHQGERFPATSRSRVHPPAGCPPKAGGWHPRESPL